MYSNKYNSLHVVHKAVKDIWCEQLKVEPQWEPVLGLLGAPVVYCGRLVELGLKLTAAITGY